MKIHDKLKIQLYRLGLSDREMQVVAEVNKGLTNMEVAKNLFVTEKTIKFHLTNIYKKMPVSNRTQLIVWMHKQR